MGGHKIAQHGPVTVYGSGSPGGKGAGLMRIDECALPRSARLRTHILATEFYQRFRNQDGAFGPEEEKLADEILANLGDVPIGVRSSGTNEAGAGTGDARAIHAGEYRSFMLPNNHADRAVRRRQLLQAVRHIYGDFTGKQVDDSVEQMAILVNPIPGLLDETKAGPVYYPFISGVADSFFPFALRGQDPNEGFARIAFGHGYATVLDDFPVISMATIRNPIPIQMLRGDRGQQHFYALDMTKNTELTGEELETMSTLHVRFANFHKIKLLGFRGNFITIEELVQKDHFGFKSGLASIMDTIANQIGSRFQVEFVFNIDFGTKPYREGVFHVVQLTLLPELSHDALGPLPDSAHTYLSTEAVQGHGIKRGIKHAVVISPFSYTKDQHDEVRAKLREINRRMRADGQSYVAILPGRIGSTNREWGIGVEFSDVDQAAALFEYGVDVAGRGEVVPERDSQTGGIYGSHFLYMIQGGHDETQKQRETRMYGTQGTHFLTNIMSNDVFYGFLAPQSDHLDPWFFSPPSPNESIYVLTFPAEVTLYADSVAQRCVVLSEVTP